MIESIRQDERMERGKRTAATRGNERGFTYIALLILIAIMSVGLAAVADVWFMTLKREKEEELLFAGHQIRNAIALYYNHTPSGVGRFPARLDDLLLDPRYPSIQRYLRKIYRDPITNSSEWELVKGPNGEILGVHSRSEDEPAKKSDFILIDQGFEGKMKYSEWVFMISGSRVPAAPSTKPAGVPRRRVGP